jgi:hypothetical protein
LPECKPQANGFLQLDSVGSDGFVGQKRHKAAASGVRPDVRAQNILQLACELKGRFALADPFDDPVTPVPGVQKGKVLLNQVDRQVHLPALDVGIGVAVGNGSFGKQVFRLHYFVSHADNPVQTFYVWIGSDQERRQLVKFIAWYLQEPPVT